MLRTSLVAWPCSRAPGALGRLGRLGRGGGSRAVVGREALLEELLLELVELLVVLLGHVRVFILLRLQLLLLLVQLFVALQDVDELGELVRVGLLDFLKEFLINLHTILLLLDVARFLLVFFEALFGLLNLVLEHFNALQMKNSMRTYFNENVTYLVLEFLELDVLLTSVLLQLQKVRELDEVVLNKNILFTELMLLQFEATVTPISIVKRSGHIRSIHQHNCQ